MGPASGKESIDPAYEIATLKAQLLMATKGKPYTEREIPTGNFAWWVQLLGHSDVENQNRLTKKEFSCQDQDLPVTQLVYEGGIAILASSQCSA